MNGKHIYLINIMMAFILMVIIGPLESVAVTITYENPGPNDSRVFVGFDNDASGNMTSDFIADPFAYSRNDTVYGPLPPAGQLPNFDAKAYASAELGTNLNAPLGSGIWSVFAPLNLTFFQAHGEALQASGFYSSSAYAHSGEIPSTTPTSWTVHVDPSGGEVAGQLADVVVTGDISGVLSVAGASSADAGWNVATTLYGTVINGSSTLAIPGTTSFSDSGTITFSLPLGNTFELLVDFNLLTSGNGAGADSKSEVTSALVQITATVPSVILVPPVISSVVAVQILPPKPILVGIAKSFKIYNPDNLKYTLETRVFTNEKIQKQDKLTEDILVPGTRDRHGKGRFYLILLSLVDEIGNEQKEVVFGAYVPRTNSRKDILKIQKRARIAQRRIAKALKKSDVYALDPARYRLYEYGWE